jgi:calmodulin
MDELSVSKLREYREIFEMFDRDKDGSINPKELNEVMGRLLLDSNLSSDETENEKIMKEIISDIDVDGNEQIDFEEFVVMMHKRNRKSDNLRDDLYNAFKIFDKDNDGKISNEELTYMLTTLGDKLTEEEINEILKEADTDHDGYINYMEFVESILNNK